MQEQSFVWFAYLFIQALRMQKPSAARLARNAEVGRFCWTLAHGSPGASERGAK